MISMARKVRACAAMLLISLISCAARSALPETLPNSEHPLQLVEQYYPAESRRLGEQGTCVVRITVTAEGEIRDVILTKSSGYPRLDQACLNGFRGNHMRPAIRNGQPVTMTKEIPVRWALSASSTLPISGPVKPDVEISCIRQDGLCDVVRLQDDRHATLLPTNVLAYLADELKLPSKSKLSLAARTGTFDELKSQMQSKGYLVVNSAQIG
jgi:TonB family protein